MRATDRMCDHKGVGLLDRSDAIKMEEYILLRRDSAVGQKLSKKCFYDYGVLLQENNDTPTGARTLEEENQFSFCGPNIHFAM